MAVSPIGPREIALGNLRRDEGAPAAGESFANAMQRVVEEANQHQIDAHRTISDLVVHGKGSVHDAMIAMQTAEGSFRLLMEMRNRLVDGVNRLLQTQV